MDENIYASVIDSYNKELAKFDKKLLTMYFSWCLANSVKASKEDRAKCLKVMIENLSRLERLKLKVMSTRKQVEFLHRKIAALETLQKNFEDALSDCAKQHNLTANHVFGGKVEDIKKPNAVLHTSRDCLTQYERRRGDYLFASSLPMGKYLYSIRDKNSVFRAMKLGKEKAFLFLGGNVDENGRLKEERLVFNLPIDEFFPETIFTKDFKFVFGDEWLCKHGFQVCDEKGEFIVGTEILGKDYASQGDYSIYIEKDDKARDILNSFISEDKYALDKIAGCLVNDERFDRHTQENIMPLLIKVCDTENSYNQNPALENTK